MLGILLLHTRFPRPPGDIGHPQTFGFPVKRRVVEGARPRRIVRGPDDDIELHERMVEANAAMVKSEPAADSVSESVFAPGAHPDDGRVAP